MYIKLRWHLLEKVFFGKVGQRDHLATLAIEAAAEAEAISLFLSRLNKRRRQNRLRLPLFE
jgi:ribonucleotide reductase alpha subunit